MKNNKFSIILFLIIMISVLVMTIGSSYAFFIKTDNKNEENKIIEKKLNILIKYESGDKIDIKNIYPGWEDGFSFNIENFSKDTIGNYKLTFDVITPLSNMIEKDFVYSLSGESKSIDSSNILIHKNETPIPIVSKDIGNGTITPNNIHTYTLNLKVNNNGQNKYYLRGKMFVGQIKITNNYD